MIECIFTIDYEIYGNGDGSLKELVYDPAQKLMGLFDKADIKLVVFVEAAEIEMIDAFKTDPAIEEVKEQIRDLYIRGHEIALHLHPQWYNARYEDGKWQLDYSEYNLCLFPVERIAERVHRSIKYLKTVLSEPDYTPCSFRAGNWLFQPTISMVAVLAENGIKIDSSVFKGGLQHQHGLDYRQSTSNGYFWKFKNNVNIPDTNGTLLEIPIFTQMAPFWKMATKKRLGLQRKASSTPTTQTVKQKFYRLLDMARFKHPLKLDFCRMTIDELTDSVDTVIEEDQQDPTSLKPLVTIGHTKDLTDFKTIELFLSYLDRKGIAVTTFNDIYQKCQS